MVQAILFAAGNQHRWIQHFGGQLGNLYQKHSKYIYLIQLLEMYPKKRIKNIIYITRILLWNFQGKIRNILIIHQKDMSYMNPGTFKQNNNM